MFVNVDDLRNRTLKAHRVTVTFIHRQTLHRSKVNRDSNLFKGSPEQKVQQNGSLKWQTIPYIVHYRGSRVLFGMQSLSHNIPVMGEVHNEYSVSHFCVGTGVCPEHI